MLKTQILQKIQKIQKYTKRYKNINKYRKNTKELIKSRTRNKDRKFRTIFLRLNIQQCRNDIVNSNQF